MEFFVVAALSYTVSQAWNTAFQNFFQTRLNLRRYGPWIYAIILTFIAYGVIKTLGKNPPWEKSLLMEDHKKDKP